jgi:hypothetical protein
MITPRQQLFFKWTVYVTLLLVSAISLFRVWYIFSGTSNITEHSSLVCLQGQEIASYNIPDKQADPAEIDVFVSNGWATSSTKIFSRSILSGRHYHPAEVRTCGIYFAQDKNYDFNAHKALPNYAAGIWRFDYAGNGVEIAALGSTTPTGYENHYQNDFRVSPSEKYISLIRGNISTEDFALVIRDIAAQKDIFALPLSTIAETSPDYAGNISFLTIGPYFGWSDDSRYFWAATYDGAVVKSYIRVDTSDLSYRIFSPPETSMGGDPLNTEFGLVTYTPGAVWTGMDVMDQQIESQMLAAGYVDRLYLYNLFTKKSILLAEDPVHVLWWGAPTWTSSTTLQYRLADGTVKTYTVPETFLTKN